MLLFSGEALDLSEGRIWRAAGFSMAPEADVWRPDVESGSENSGVEYVSAFAGEACDEATAGGTAKRYVF